MKKITFLLAFVALALQPLCADAMWNRFATRFAPTYASMFRARSAVQKSAKSLPTGTQKVEQKLLYYNRLMNMPRNYTLLLGGVASAFAGYHIATSACEAPEQKSKSSVNVDKYNVAKDKYPELYNFISTYGLPDKDQQIFESLGAEAREKSFGIVDGLPDFFLKGKEINRVINAERMRACIERYKLDKLGVTQKYVNPQFKVFAKTVNNSGGTTLSLKHIQQLAKLAEETGFRDWENNWIFENGKLVCIDTEDLSFISGMYRGVEGIELPQHCKANYVISLMTWRRAMQPDAEQWLVQHINNLAHSPEGTAKDVPLYDNKKFDSAIDFERVKQEFSQFREQQ